jgi:hypothetical protein
MEDHTMVQQELTGRDLALARVIEQRTGGRARPRAVRIALAAAGIAGAVVAVPLAIVLPELGVPLLLLALRVLAVEFDWAARGYAWVIWRWEQIRAWYRAASAPVRAVVALVLLALAVGLLWLLAHELHWVVPG